MRDPVLVQSSAAGVLAWLAAVLVVLSLEAADGPMLIVLAAALGMLVRAVADLAVRLVAR